MQRKTRCLFVVFLLLANLVVYAQSITVTGKVVDSDGLEVIGANVTLKGAPRVGGDYRSEWSLQIKTQQSFQ